MAQIARGSTTMMGGGGGGRSKSSRRKSQGGGSSGGSGNARSTPVTMNGPMGQNMGLAASCSGESDEYDDSCGSESDECSHPHHQHRHHLQQQHQHLVMGMMGSGESTMSSKACRYSAVPVSQGVGTYGPGGARPIFLNDETLLVGDKERKSLPRGLRPKFSYGSSSGIGSMLSPGPVSSSSTAGYQIPPGGLGRSSGSSGGSSTASRGGGNYTTSTTDETSFILMSAGLGSGNATASAAIHPHSTYDYDYDLVAAAAAAAASANTASSLAHGNKYLGGNTTSRQASCNLPPPSSASINTMKMQQNSAGPHGGSMANCNRIRETGGGMLGGDPGNKTAIKTDLISHHHHHPQQSSDYTIAV